MFKSKFISFFKFITNGKFIHLYGSLRRRFIFYFRKNYLNRQLSVRKGNCTAKGHCCGLTMPWCEYICSGKCSLYARQPLFCRIFPIDEEDKELSGVKDVCGYYFK